MTKIVDLEAVLVSVPAEGNAFTETESEDMLVVLVTDDDGNIGFGECHAAPPVVKAMVDYRTEHFWAHGIVDHVIGERPD